MTIPLDIERVALLGWKVYPASNRSKAGCFKGATAAATSELATLDEWAFRYPRCNWRVVTGPSFLFALDVDQVGTHAYDGFAALTELCASHGPLPSRPMTRSGGSGGAALFFHHAGEELRGKSGVPAPGIDPHRGSQAITIPPSRHPVSGGSYTWRKNSAPWELAPPAIPTWLAQLLKPLPVPPPLPYVVDNARANKALYNAMEAVAHRGSEGGRNDLLNRRCFYLGKLIGDGQLRREDVAYEMMTAALRAGLPRKEAEDTIKSALRSGERRPL